MTRPIARNPASKRKSTATTVFALLSELTRKTADDSVVVAALAGIFSAYDVRHRATLAPVRIVGGRSPRPR